jgi:asparagine synthase (glutamine-hydrolysing)
VLQPVVITQNSHLNEDYLLHFWQELEINTKLSRYLLSTQGDRVALANSVEQRFPFLDEDLVEFTSKLPDSWLIFKNRAKYILKRAMLGKIPHVIIDRPKQGYLAPDRAILDLYISGKSYFNHLLSQRYLESTGYFDVVKVNGFLHTYANEKYLNNKYVNLAFLFMVTTQILHKLFVEKDLDFLST